MNPLIPLIPSSIISLIGLAVLMGIFIMGGTFFQEWAKTIYRKMYGKERRHSNLEDAIAHLIQTIDTNTEELHKWQERIQFDLQETKDTVDNIHRKQDRNWKQLFEEELKTTCKVKHGN